MNTLFSSAVDWGLNLFDSVHLWLFETLVQPVMFALGASVYLEDAFDATMWLLIGALELTFLLVVIGALQRWRPVEAVTDRLAVRVDVIYTLIHRLGLFRLGLFFGLLPIIEWTKGLLHVQGWVVPPVDQVWPGVTDVAWVSLLIYLLVFDLMDYGYHRAQHRFTRFWALHAVHHSQRQMTMWSDNRNHLLDDVLRSLVIVVVSFVLGVPPEQFVMVVVITQLLESFSHANVRMSFGRWFERVLVSPKYHRHHHYIGADAAIGGYNFAVLFPVWDILFGTARFDGHYGPTGVHDQSHVSAYGQGFWAQQRLGLLRFLGVHKVV